MNASQRVSKEILSWPHATSGQHRFGGLEFRVGAREMGHLHGDTLADLPFPMDIRRLLVNSGRVSPHHIFPQSGWISKWIRSEEDVLQVIELFKIQYERLTRKTVRSTS